jgi:hypothetical protein
MKHDSNLALVIAGVALVALVLYRRKNVAEAAGVTTTNKGGLTTTPIQTTAVETAGVSAPPDGWRDIYVAAPKIDVRSLVIPESGDVLQPFGDINTQLAAWNSAPPIAAVPSTYSF